MSDEQIYPLLFHPIFKEKIWGGEKIKTFLKKEAPTKHCGESWELSGIAGSVSQVKNGVFKGESLQKLLEQYGEDILGKAIFAECGTNFPLLVKFIDAKRDLSVQVHPGDALAAKRHQCRGKTEMWYVLQAEEDAKLINGFERTLKEETYLKKLEDGKVLEVLNEVSVSPGDAFYIPAGRVHAIGAGVLLLEIQQSTDITYRIYDYNRTDAQGNTRTLHTQEALAAIDYHTTKEHKIDYKPQKNEAVSLLKSPYFNVKLHTIDRKTTMDFSENAHFTILIGLENEAKLQTAHSEEVFKMGDVYLIPAKIPAVEICQKGESFKFIECFIE